MSATMDTNMDLMKFLETDHKSLLRATDIAKIFGISIETVYDWNYRAKMKKIPEGTFVKINQMLFVRTDLLKNWVLSKMTSRSKQP
jgi:sulfatase maturation enzyme AslB (radical SAM superfamily)